MDFRARVVWPCYISLKNGLIHLLSDCRRFRSTDRVPSMWFRDFKVRWEKLVPQSYLCLGNPVTIEKFDPWKFRATIFLLRPWSVTLCSSRPWALWFSQRSPAGVLAVNLPCKNHPHRVRPRTHLHPCYSCHAVFPSIILSSHRLHCLSWAHILLRGTQMSLSVMRPYSLENSTIPFQPISLIQPCHDLLL